MGCHFQFELEQDIALPFTPIFEEQSFNESITSIPGTGDSLFSAASVDGTGSVHLPATPDEDRSPVSVETYWIERGGGRARYEEGTNQDGGNDVLLESAYESWLAAPPEPRRDFAYWRNAPVCTDSSCAFCRHSDESQGSGIVEGIGSGN